MQELVVGNGFYEMSMDEQINLDGGSFPWAEVAKAAVAVAAAHPVAAAVVITGAAAYACYKAGESVGKGIGEAIYNAKH